MSLCHPVVWCTNIIKSKQFWLFSTWHHRKTTVENGADVLTTFFSTWRKCASLLAHPIHRQDMDGLGLLVFFFNLKVRWRKWMNNNTASLRYWMQLQHSHTHTAERRREKSSALRDVLAKWGSLLPQGALLYNNGWQFGKSHCLSQKSEPISSCSGGGATHFLRLFGEKRVKNWFFKSHSRPNKKDVTVIN